MLLMIRSACSGSSVADVDAHGLQPVRVDWLLRQRSNRARTGRDHARGPGEREHARRCRRLQLPAGRLQPRGPPRRPARRRRRSGRRAPAARRPAPGSRRRSRSASSSNGSAVSSRPTSWPGMATENRRVAGRQGVGQRLVDHRAAAAVRHADVADAPAVRPGSAWSARAAAGAGPSRLGRGRRARPARAPSGAANTSMTPTGRPLHRPARAAGPPPGWPAASGRRGRRSRRRRRPRAGRGRPPRSRPAIRSVSGRRRAASAAAPRPARPGAGSARAVELAVGRQRQRVQRHERGRAPCSRAASCSSARPQRGRVELGAGAATR